MTTQTQRLMEVFSRLADGKVEAVVLRAEAEVLIASVKRCLSDAVHYRDQVEQKARASWTDDMKVQTALELAEANGICKEVEALLAQVTDLDSKTEAYSLHVDTRVAAELALILES